MCKCNFEKHQDQFCQQSSSCFAASLWNGVGGICAAVLLSLQNFRSEREKFVARLRLPADQRYEKYQDHDDHGADDSGHDARVVLEDVGHLRNAGLIALLNLSLQIASSTRCTSSMKLIIIGLFSISKLNQLCAYLRKSLMGVALPANGHTPGDG